MNKLGVGIVGAGFVAKTFHIPGWQGVREADIQAICDLDKKKAQDAAKKARELKVGDPDVYTDVKEMVRSSKVNAIWITVPNFARLPVLKEILSEYKKKSTYLIGLACEKPLGRNVNETRKMVELVEETDLLHGYLENQVFAPSITKGKNILWERGAKTTGRPYLARCAEEHSGPHESWFWSGAKQGGGVLNDMGCHSLEASRFLLTAPHESKDALRPQTVNGEISTLKWLREGYVEQLEKVSFKEMPVEDFAKGSVVYELPSGDLAISEITVSWNYLGPGLRLSFELHGPEYSMEARTLDSGLNLFFSREVKGKKGEDLVEKQKAEQGQMPVIPDETVLYGYVNEDRYMVEKFQEGEMPEENWNDGLLVIELLMSLYMSAEKGERLEFPPENLDEFEPKVARGGWNPKSIAKGHKA